jgi:hypothetical protein
MKRRNFLKMLPVGLLAARFGGLVELVKPKKPWSLSAEIIPLQMENSKRMAEFFQPAMDKLLKDWESKAWLYEE